MTRLLSAIKPTSWSPTLGNYLGAIKQFVKYQDQYETFIFIADLHALTLPISANELRENTRNLIAVYLAAGLDPKKVTIFKQSDVPAHNQLEWILTCNTKLSDLTKMPQYKNYCEKFDDRAVPAGLLLYPSLMNSDILLYDAEVIPVGLDQKPHIDLARDIAEEFNKKYSKTFILPKAIIEDTGAKIMSLSDPTKKMSKSESEAGTIYLLEDLDSVRKKIKKAVTDSEDKVYFNIEHKPGISNLIQILASLSNCSITDIENSFSTLIRETTTSVYGVFKNAVADTVCIELNRLQERVKQIKESDLIDRVLEDGKRRANKLSDKKITEVYTKIGLR